MEIGVQWCNALVCNPSSSLLPYGWGKPQDQKLLSVRTLNLHIAGHHKTPVGSQGRIFLNPHSKALWCFMDVKMGWISIDTHVGGVANSLPMSSIHWYYRLQAPILVLPPCSGLCLGHPGNINAQFHAAQRPYCNLFCGKHSHWWQMGWCWSCHSAPWYQEHALTCYHQFFSMQVGKETAQRKSSSF